MPHRGPDSGASVPRLAGRGLVLPRMLVGTAQLHETKGDTMTARSRLVSRSLAAAAAVAT